MPILTPTKDAGSTAKANEVVYVEPALTVADADLAAMVEIDGVNTAFVSDFLSACLTHERCGTHLYRSVAGRTHNPVLQAKYEEFGGETLRHVEILEAAITALGGNAAYVSPLARAVEAADNTALEATFLGSGGLDPMSAEMAMLDAVFMGETVCHANWEAIGQLAGSFPVGPARRALEDACAEVGPDEEEHYGWARDTRARLTMLQADNSLVAGAAAKGEELLAQIKSWFTGASALDRPMPAPTKKASARTGKAPAKRTAKKTTGKATTKAAPARKAAAGKAAAAGRKGPAKKAPAKANTATKARTASASKRSPAKKASGSAARKRAGR